MRKKDENTANAAFSHVWSKFVHWFWRRKQKRKIKVSTTTTKFRSEKLTYAFLIGSDEQTAKTIHMFNSYM